MVQQSFHDYEVIVVDQNDDERVAEVFEEFPTLAGWKHIRCSPGLSKSRNLGISWATGEIIAFPDDDCWYTPDLLANVDRWFRDSKGYSIFAVGAEDGDGIPSGNRWIQAKCDLHPVNIFRTTFCSSLFILRNERFEGTKFDENIGPGSGTIFDCGEETDFVLQLMDRGLRGRFDRTWHVCHPRRDMLSGSISRRRAVGYGRGMGGVLRKHSLYSVWIGLVLYDFFRALIVAGRGKLSAASLCFAHGQGVMSGFSASVTPDITLKQEVNL